MSDLGLVRPTNHGWKGMAGGWCVCIKRCREFWKRKMKSLISGVESEITYGLTWHGLLIYCSFNIICMCLIFKLYSWVHIGYSIVLIFIFRLKLHSNKLFSETKQINIYWVSFSWYNCFVSYYIIYYNNIVIVYYTFVLHLTTNDSWWRKEHYGRSLNLVLLRIFVFWIHIISYAYCSNHLGVTFM